MPDWRPRAFGQHHPAFGQDRTFGRGHVFGPRSVTGRTRALAQHRVFGQRRRLAVGLAAVSLAIAAAGCSSSAKASPVTCGVTRTAANVPVHIQVVHGPVACPMALTIERAYVKDIQSGKVPGTGGGAPDHVMGWTCTGFATPVVLRTGDASKCTSGHKEIIAVLPNPT